MEHCKPVKSNCCKCPYNGKGDDTCISCRWSGGLCNGGVSHVSLDAAANPETVLIKGKVHPDWTPHGAHRRQKVLSGESDETCEWLQRLLSDLADLSGIEVDIVHGLAHGMTVGEICKGLCVPVRDVRVALRGMLSRRGHLRALIDHARGVSNRKPKEEP